MKKVLLFSIVFLAALSAFAQSLTDAQFLQAIKEGTSFSPQFKASMLFESQTPGGEPSEATFTLYENSGKSIAIFRTPVRDKGKAILQIESKYWMYFPKTKRATVLSPMANMVGNASNGDVLRPPLSELYEISLLNTKPGKGNRTVQFIASSRKAPYGKIITYYDDEKAIEAELYSRSGILLKKAYYLDHIKNKVGFGWMPMKTRIVDGKNEEKHTTITFSELETLNNLNQSWFNPNNLGRVR